MPQQPGEQRRLAAAQEAGQNRDRKLLGQFLELHYLGHDASAAETGRHFSIIASSEMGSPGGTTKMSPSHRPAAICRISPSVPSTST